MPAKTYPILTQAGIKRDGTRFEGNYYTDGQWCRFQRGKPRKMGGYRQMTGDYQGISRGARIDTQNGLIYVHSGSNDKVEVSNYDFNGGGGTVTDRTPVGYTGSDFNMWQFDAMWDSSGSPQQLILAHGAPNLSSIDSNVTAPIYFGNSFTTAPLTAISSSNCSGGIAVLHPYLFYYGSDGLIGWSVEGVPTDLTNTGSGQARVTGGKVVKGLSARAGSGNAPAGLFWATDALIRTTFVGGTPIFNFDRISQGYSILSSQAIVEYEGVYFWPGVDRFLLFDGAIRELPNSLSINWFYDGLNWNRAQTCFAMRVPRWGEIWFCHPRGDALWPTHALIFNVREKTFYDTELPEGGRSFGYTDSIFRYPIMFGAEEDADGETVLWQHEFLRDKQVGSSATAIKSYFVTGDISLAVSGLTGNELGGGDAVNLTLEAVDPDFVLNGSMTMQAIGYPYPQSDPQILIEKTFTQDTNRLNITKNARELYLRFESNEEDGDYQMGQPVLHITGGPGRP